MTSVVRAGADDRKAVRSAEIERIVMIVALPLVFARLDLPVPYITVSLLVIGALAPVWLGALRRYESSRMVLALCVVAIVCGVWLAANSMGERRLNLPVAYDTAAGMATFIGAIGVVLWARTALRDYHIALLAGIGQLATVSTTSELYSTNPWRFGYSIPVTIVVLALAWWTGNRWVQIGCLVALAGVSAVNDARSNFAMLILAAILMFVGRQSADGGRRRSWLPTVMLVGAVAWAVFQVAQTLILGGYLGQTTQQRSEAQVNASGSLLLGGRPELAATTALMREQPFGFGLGAVPSFGEISTAKQGMASINYDPNNGYVERYMLGGHFELHSVFGDLWASFGVAGLLLTAAIIMVCVRGTALSLRSGSAASALMLYLAIRTLWGVAFSPFNSASLLIALFIGLILLERAPSTQPSGRDGPVAA